MESSHVKKNEDRILHIESKINELYINHDLFIITQADILNKQTELSKKFDDIHDALVGKGEYDIEENGGICGEVKRIRKDVNSLKTWRTRLTAIWLTVSSIFTVAITLLTLWFKTKVTN